MNALYEELPQSVMYEDEAYPIITDFREWVRFIDAARSDELSGPEKARHFLQWYTDGIPDDKAEAINLLRSFLIMSDVPRVGKKLTPQQQAKQDKKPPTLDYEYDAPCIIAAFQESYGINLLTCGYMHWWEFRFLLDNVNKDTELAFRRSYRAMETKDIKDKNEKARIIKIKNSIALPNSVRELTDYEIGSAF